MITDTEFQNRRDVMRVAPWLDMSLLRTELQVSLQTQLGSGGIAVGYVASFKEDMQAFCDGERERVPRCGSVTTFVHREILRLFPAARNDSTLGDAFSLVCSHIMQIGTWRSYERGAGSQDTPPEAPYRINPNIGVEDEHEYDEYDDEEEY